MPNNSNQNMYGSYHSKSKAHQHFYDRTTLIKFFLVDGETTLGLDSSSMCFWSNNCAKLGLGSLMSLESNTTESAQKFNSQKLFKMCKVL